MKALSSDINYYLPELSIIEEKLEGIISQNKDLNISQYYNIGRGKKIRPALFLVCSGLLGNEKEQLFPIACALELIHNATLIHDDVVDRSEKRRGHLTINSLYGNQAAVLYGDFLFTEAFKLLVSYGNLEVIKVLSEVVSDMTAGEIKQFQESYDKNITEGQYLQRVTQKTALFFAACCFLAGVVNDAQEEEKQRLWRFGLNLGVAFQVRDDMLDLQGDEMYTGKETGSDLKNGVVTLPLIFAMHKPSFQEKLFLILQKSSFSDKDIHFVRSEVEACGGFSYSMGVAQRYLTQALSELSFFPASEEKDILEQAAYYIMYRKT